MGSLGAATGRAYPAVSISLKDFVARLNEHLDDMCTLTFTDEELNFIANIPFMRQDFVEYLRMFRYNRNYIRATKVDDSLEIIAEGPWLNTILFEVPVLKLVSTLYTKHNGIQKATWLEEGRKNLEAKLRYLQANLHKDSKFGFGDSNGNGLLDFVLGSFSLAYDKPHIKVLEQSDPNMLSNIDIPDSNEMVR